MNKIVILDSYTLNPGDLSWSSIIELGDVRIYDRTEEELILSRIGEANIVITNKTVLTEEILSQCKGIEYIGVLATGYNVVDIEYCKNNNIVVTNVPTYGTEEVAQHVFALILELTNHVADYSKKALSGKWEESKDFCFFDKPLVSLSGKTLGIIGSGKIGLKTAEIAKAFGMKILATNSKNDENVVDDNFSYVKLNDLLKNADIISLHCPLNKKTDKMINKTSINMMKDGVILINTSRGQLINENDLYCALESGKVSSCGIDVLGVEPPKNNVLLKASNIVITPHIAWAAKKARLRLMEIASNNIKEFIEGNIIYNVY